MFLEITFLFVIKNYLKSSDQFFDVLMSGFLPKCCAASFLLLLGTPTLSQPQLAVPIRTFPPGVQVDSPVPIKRGNDVVRLEGFPEPEKGHRVTKRIESSTSAIQGNSGDSASGSDSMFGYEDKGAKPVSEESKTEMGLDEVDSITRAEGDKSADDAAVFGSEMEDDCSKASASTFCRAFN